MEHNNKHLLPGFHPASFPSAFAGLQNAGTNAFMSTLQQLSGLSAPLLPGSALGAAQWANSQSTGQTWIDPAKVAAMLPMYQVFTGVKGLYVHSIWIPCFFRESYAFRDISQPELISQQSITPVSSTTTAATTSSSIFPATVVKTSLRNSPSNSCSPLVSGAQNSPAGGPMSNGPSSHPSTSTPHDIDVGGLSQPSSQTQAYDLTVRSSPSAKTPDASGSQDFSSRPSNSFKTASGLSHPESQPSTSQGGAQPVVDDNWAGIDLGDLDLFTGTSSKENEAAISSVFELGGNLFPDSFHESPQKTSTFSATSISQSAASHTEITTADQEFDQIFSSLENQNASANAFPFDFHSGENNPSLSPVQFTPPDSPSAGSPDRNIMGLFAGPSTSSIPPTTTHSPFPAPSQTPAPSVGSAKRKTDSVKPIAAPSPSSFKKEPLVTRPVQKCNKIPIYKQRKFTSVISSDSNVESKGDVNDAYSFEDEEENVGLGQVDPKEKLDAEVREKLSKIAGQHPEMRNKNIYVPGVGFAVPPEQQQDLWRHVVPKKRPTGENRPVIPAANLLPPSVHAEASQAAARLAEPEIVTLAESIRRRKKERLVCGFIKTEQTYGSDCAKEEGADRRAEEARKECESQPRLPKLIIKLPRRSTENYYESKKKKKKKRKKKDYDSDWEGSDRTRRKKRMKREKSSSSGYEVRIVERDNEDEGKAPKIEEERIDVSMFSKKRRLMMQWQEGQENQNRENGEHKTNVRSYSFRSRNDFNTEAVRTRLSKFGPADGHLPKGTFVVCKADLFRDDCALWRVDNQNMIQKYPPRIDPATKDISYKNSSTYSGWCDQVAFGYYRVAIKHIKQTRSEAIIQPEIPISDLFPAMTSECNDTNGFVKGDDETTTDPEDHVTMLRDPLRLSLYTFTIAMISHALTLEFLQQIKSKNDWNFLRAVTEVEKVNSDSLTKLRGLVKFNEKLEDAMHSYTQLCITESDYHSLQCQASLHISLYYIGNSICTQISHGTACCALKPIERIIQLYSLDSYDPETLQSTERPQTDTSPLPAVEFLVCPSCANTAQLYHRCYHMKYHLLKKCEDKLEVIGTQHPEYSPEKTVEAARKCRVWLNKVLSDYMDTWKKIQNLDH
ncbi:hypothetical protein Y032_0009g754 [Ancylostoma ceylanicum]|uniref:DUF4211 domain-containing protein n=1 Tax=Ancylostoma ceylanicum TaxID=53326 RepID=A0A016VJM5_9BILA|nr:hypothetical protein Y032_0009g754 [Ancylostoma ceylanicum]